MSSFGKKADRAPCRPLEIAFSIDTTGSMHEVLRVVGDQIHFFMRSLGWGKVRSRFAVIVHGDYCDEKKTYTSKMINFSEEQWDIQYFIACMAWTGGGDEGECYEVALKLAREKLSWSKYSSKTLFVIGDSCPHETDYKDNTDHIDWREETQRLADMGVEVIGVQLGNSPDSASTQFFETLAMRTGGIHRKTMPNYQKMYDIVVDKAKAVKKSRNRPRLCQELLETTSTPNDKNMDCTEVNVWKTIPHRTKRESVPEPKFLLKHLPWTTWKLALKAFDNSDTKSWTKRRVGPGYKVRQLYTRSPGTYLYELSVEGNTGKKAVVFSKVSNCDPCSGSWESQLLGHRFVRDELKRLFTGHRKTGDRRIYIRRAKLANQSSIINAKDVLEKYDYAWSCVPGQRSSRRMFMMDNVRASAPSGFDPYQNFW